MLGVLRVGNPEKNTTKKRMSKYHTTISKMQNISFKDKEENKNKIRKERIRMAVYLIVYLINKSIICLDEMPSLD